MGKATVALNVPNVTTNFRPADDNWRLEYLPFKASTAIAQGALVQPETSGADTTGYLTIAGVENAGGDDFWGIMAEPIASGDSDYATAGKLKGVYVPNTPFAKAFFRVGAGTFTIADVFKTVEIHSDSASLAVDTVGKGARIVEYISSTKGKCRFSLPETEVA